MWRVRSTDDLYEAVLRPSDRWGRFYTLNDIPDDLKQEFLRKMKLYFCTNKHRTPHFNKLLNAVEARWGVKASENVLNALPVLKAIRPTTKTEPKNPDKSVPQDGVGVPK